MAITKERSKWDLLDQLGSAEQVAKHFANEATYYLQLADRLVQSKAPQPVRLIAAGRILHAAETGKIPFELYWTLQRKILPDMDAERFLEWASFGDLDE